MLFGTLLSSASSAAAVAHAHVQVVELELGWDAYMPADGVVDASYEAAALAKLQAFTAAGLQVVLGVGLQYPPAWVFTYSNSRFVNQYGAAASGVANLTFNQTLRTRAETYMDRVITALGASNVWAVRIGSGGLIECLYPGEDADGAHTNSYWGYDATAQASCPYPGWHPGDTTYNAQPFTAAMAQAWYAWYLGALVGGINWQIDYWRGKGLTSNLHILMPGQGIRPADYSAAIAALLNGTGDGNATLGRGAVWPLVCPSLHSPASLVAYCSSLADGSGIPANDAFQPGDDAADLSLPAVSNWSAGRLLHSLAARNGLAFGGENPGRSDALTTWGVGMMQAAINQVGTNGSLFMLAHEPELFTTHLTGNNMTLADYASLISTERNVPMAVSPVTAQDLISQRFLPGTEIPGWQDPGGTGTWIDQDVFTPAVEAWATSALIPLYRWGGAGWDTMTTQTNPAGNAGTMTPAAIQNVLTRIHTELNAQVLIKLPPIRQADTYGNFDPNVWGYANLLTMLKNIIDAAGPLCNFYEWCNEPDNSELSLLTGKNLAQTTAYWWIKISSDLKKYYRAQGYGEMILVGPAFMTGNMDSSGNDTADLAKCHDFMADVYAAYVANPDADLRPDAFTFHSYAVEIPSSLTNAALYLGKFVDNLRLTIDGIWGPVMGPKIRIGLSEWNVNTTGSTTGWDSYYTLLLTTLQQHNVAFACQFVITGNNYPADTPNVADMITPDGLTVSAYGAAFKKWCLASLASPRIAASLASASNQYFSAPSTPSLQMGAGVHMTVAGWFYITSGATVDRHIIAKRDGSGPNLEWFIQRGSGGYVGLSVSSTGALAGVVTAWAGVPSTGVWHFIAGWYDGVSLYCEIDNGAPAVVPFTADIYAGSAELDFGAGNAGGFLWDGGLSGWSLWKTALTPAQLTALYNSGNYLDYAQFAANNIPLPVSHWPLGEFHDLRYDLAGTNDLTPHNTPGTMRR